MDLNIAACGHHRSSSKGLPMGLAVHSWLPYLLVLQFGTFGFVGLQVYQQRVISQQLRELSWEPEPRCDCSGSPGDVDPVPGSSHTGNSKRPPDLPEVGRWKSERFEALGLASGLGHPVTLLVLVLFALLAIGCILHRNRSDCYSGVSGDSPISKQQLAQRQLAEIRLRRHGFAR